MKKFWKRKGSKDNPIEVHVSINILFLAGVSGLDKAALDDSAEKLSQLLSLQDGHGVRKIFKQLKSKEDILIFGAIIGQTKS